ncbi:MAG: hypothetical protein LYZ70_00195 [Nitrososphaerales archaeon]|nr:hypothetical protein [Nitrososphaerales archaeon]
MRNPFDKLYWLRIGSGVAAGVVAYFVFRLPGLDFSYGILVGLFVFLLTYYIAKYGWYRKLEAAKLTKLYSTGIGSYVMLFLFTWILLLTLL